MDVSPLVQVYLHTNLSLGVHVRRHGIHAPLVPSLHVRNQVRGRGNRVIQDERVPIPIDLLHPQIYPDVAVISIQFAMDEDVVGETGGL